MKLIVVCAIALAALNVHAAQDAPISTPPHKAVHMAPFIAISVKNLGKMRDWYKQVFGFEVLNEGAFESRGVKFALLSNGPALIEMIEKSSTPDLSEDERKRRDSAESLGFFKSGLVVPDIDGLFGALKAAGVPFAFELSKPPGGSLRVFGVRDPDGNLIQVFGI